MYIYESYFITRNPNPKEESHQTSFAQQEAEGGKPCNGRKSGRVEEREQEAEGGKPCNGRKSGRVEERE